LGWGKAWAGGWDGNAVKLGCDDHCTTINVIKHIEFKKKKKDSLSPLQNFYSYQQGQDPGITLFKSSPKY